VQERAGLVGTYCDGIFFTEQAAETTRMQDKPISVKLARQNANLTEVKQQLAKKVSAAGGNALVGFTYGQKGTLFGWDQGQWRGSGFIAKL
jgi:hypothetical protein